MKLRQLDVVFIPDPMSLPPPSKMLISALICGFGPIHRGMFLRSMEVRTQPLLGKDNDVEVFVLTDDASGTRQQFSTLRFDGASISVANK